MLGLAMSSTPNMQWHRTGQEIMQNGGPRAFVNNKAERNISTQFWLAIAHCALRLPVPWEVDGGLRQRIWKAGDRIIMLAHVPTIC